MTWTMALAAGLGGSVMADMRPSRAAITLLNYHLDQLIRPGPPAS
ncbi:MULTISPECIES: hypothetical protein [unclassified Pseudofrankia]|nr:MULTISPECIES: hypothetical protein [unclassified Pseudofrankia]MDT3444737.1 hypothetical protein [Pseudofrankia sp. BMG5.37]